MAEAKQTNLLKTFITFFYGNAAVLILSFISKPIITRLMSPAEFGRSDMFRTVVVVISLFAIMGLDQAYIRYYYKEGVNRIVLMKQCLLPAIAAVFVLGLIYLTGAEYFNILLFGSDSFDVRMLVILYVFAAIIERFMVLNIRMQQKGNLYSIFNIVTQVLNIGLIFLAFYFLGEDYRVVLYAMTISLGIVALMTFGYFIKSDVSSIKEKKKAHSIAEKELLAYGIPFILMALVNWALTSTDRIMIRAWSGFEAVGIYAGAMAIVNVMQGFKAAFATFWVPMALEKYEHEDEASCHAFFKNVFSKVQLLCMIGAVLIILFKDIIILFLGEKYRSAMLVLPCLTIMPVMDIMFEITSQGLNFKQKLRFYNYSSIIVLFVNIAGNALLVPSYGAMGAAIATGLSYVVYFISGTIFSQKCYKVPYRFKGTLVYIPLLLLYAVSVSLFPNLLINSVCGLVTLGIICYIDKNNLMEMVGFGHDAWKKLIHRNTEK